MILEILILENVGVYAGRQEANLAPKPGKPVILFGGLNGGGKTTILEGLQLCFYGPKARLASRGTTPWWTAREEGGGGREKRRFRKRVCKRGRRGEGGGGREARGES